MSIANKLAVPAIALAAVFSAHAASAVQITPAPLNLGNAQTSGSNVEAITCFDGPPCDDRYISGNNAYAAGPYSAATTSSTLSTSPSISATSEADALKGGGSASANFVSKAIAKNALAYYFEIYGPDTISIPVAIKADATLTVTGFTSFDGDNGYSAEAQLYMGGVGLNIQRDGFLQVGGTSLSGGYSIDGTYNLLSNTAYEVNLVVNSSAAADFNTTADIIATALIDPTFTIGSGYSRYSVLYSSGIGAPPPSSTPLPSTLPLFASGLGLAGYVARRKKAARAV